MRDYLINRNGMWCYRRRVPADVAGLDRRREVKASTKSRDLARALNIAAAINAETESFWQSLRAGESRTPAAATEKFEAAVALARSLKVPYRTAADLASGDAAEILKRLDLLEQRNLTASPAARVAVLGGAAKPDVAVADLFAVYETHVRDQMRGKSDDQVRKWRNPRLRAVANFVAVAGDKRLAAIRRDDGLDFRAWWMDRVFEEDMQPGSGNKDLGHLAKMFGIMNDAWRLGLDNPFAGLRLAGDHHNPRIAYDPDFVRAHILSGSGLGGCNADARAIVMMVAATGLRPSEIVALSEDRIQLDAAIPIVQIRPDGRQLKTRHSRRDMPLVGVGLDVMRAFPQGFPRYRDAADSFSATANKALAAAGLRPTPEHTVYSLRHTFKDRLIAIEAPPRVQDALMGHAVKEIEYGAGPSLGQRATWLKRVWG